VFEALLFRLNPKYWPSWREDILADSEPHALIDIGRRKRGELGPGIPIVALGTGGLGVVAIGKTTSNVTDCIDLDCEGVAPEDLDRFVQIRPRIAARFTLVDPKENFLENELISALLKRQETLNPITFDQYMEFEAIC